MICFALCFGIPRIADAGDWPQWRFDSGRSASSPEQLPDSLDLVWTRDFPQRIQVWDDPLNHDLMPFDKVFEPVVMGGLLFVGFNDSDKVVALNSGTGEEVWRFYADGPVRFPPVAWNGAVYFVSDDGCLYCVRGENGSLIWKFQGAPSGRKVLGNERVISAWPARGGPVIRDGRIYFAASIWPFMGTFIYALSAQTGEVEWVNDGTSADYILQPHNAPSFAGVAPQGAFAATSEFLIVPGGRSVPAVFDRGTGELMYFHLAAGGKGNGGSFVAAGEKEFFVHTRYRGVRAYGIDSGKATGFLANEPVIDGSILYASSDVYLRESKLSQAQGEVSSATRAEGKAKTELKDATDPDKRKKAEKTLEQARERVAELKKVLDDVEKDWKKGWVGNLIQAFDSEKNVLWEIETDATGDLIKAGNRLYAAGGSGLNAVEVPRDRTNPSVVWSHSTKGSVQRLIAANGMLFGVTLEGSILAYGGQKPEAPETVDSPAPANPDESGAPNYQPLFDQLGAREGYALCFGLEDRALLEGLLRDTKLHVVGVDSDRERVETLRREFDHGNSLYGRRIALHHGDPVSYRAPAYFASVVIVGSRMAEGLTRSGWLESVFESVRPYGGNLWISASEGDSNALAAFIRGADLPKAIVREVTLSLSGEPSQGDSHEGRVYSGIKVTRDGALPGAADWTHQYGDIANTVKSDDQRVKLPLGLLWFGGSSNMDVLPRHGHGPPEQVIGGRAIIEGMDVLSARDVYTGRVIWKRTIENLDTYGIYFNETYTNTPLSTAYNQRHIPGANGRGSNYVATEDSIYVALEDYCEVLNAETGETINFIRLPLKKGGAVRPRWGFIGVYKDVLLAGHDFANFSKKSGDLQKNGYAPIEDLSASDGLVAFDRHTGELLWQMPARHSFVHNGIVAGNGRVYCLDKLPKSVEEKMSRRGKMSPDSYRVVSVDYRTGEQLWEASDDIFGTWLGYSEEHDILLQAGAKASDRLADEVGQGMIAYRGKEGSVLWKDLERSYTGPCILHNDLILTAVNSYRVSTGAFNLLDGSPHWIVNPLTGAEEPWLISRAYGCNTPVASEHLMTFRSGAAGYYDLSGKSGTGNLGGFKSSCTSNLVIANGVLNAPDYTRTCTCGYQNQTSLALVHMPEIEVWTHSKLGSEALDRTIVQRAGINLGAPGDRLSDDGTLWLEYPGVGGDSPEIDVAIKADQARYFRHHSTMMSGDGLPWVTASGVEGVEKITIIPMMESAKKKSVSKVTKASGESENGTGGLAQEVNPSVSSGNDAKLVYTVRLHFVEPKMFDAGQRVFGVRIQGDLVMENFDVVKQAGGWRRGVVKEFRGIEIAEKLEIEFQRQSQDGAGPVLSGVEWIAE